MKAKLTTEDKIEIYYAVMSKINQLKKEGPILMSRQKHREFIQHLNNILDRIGPDGGNL